MKQNLLRVAATTVSLAVILTLATAGIGATQQTNLPAWPMLGHDPAHRGRSEHSAAANNSGVVRWKFQPQGSKNRLSIPTIGANGIIYLAGTDLDAHSSHLYAVSPHGTQLWALPTSGRLSWENEASPAVGNDGTIYVTGVENVYNAVPEKAYVYAVSAKGDLLWQSEIEGADISAPTIGNDGIIYVGTHGPYGNGHLYAIRHNGEIRWKVETGDISNSSPAIGADGTIYVGSFGRIDFPKGSKPSPQTLSRAFYEGLKAEFDVYAIDNTGKLKWKFKTRGGVEQAPTVAPDGTIYVADIGDTEHIAASHHSPAENFYAIDRNGKLKWKLTQYWGFSAPAIGADGIIYLGFRDDSLTAYLDAMTPDGKVKWKFSDVESGRVSWQPAIGAEGTVFLSGDGLWAVNSNGTLKWKYEHAAGSPVLGADGTVYAICGNDELCAFGGSGR